MKKMLLSLSVAAALAGCGGGETLEDVKNDSVTVIPKATVKFDPANGVISVPNDLLMSGTLDGTLNIPGELNDENVSISRAEYADPQLAIGALDGWSTQVPFKIDLTFPPGISLDQTSAASPGSVRIFEVIMGASLTDAECSQAPAGAACKLVGELTFGVDFVTQASGDAVAIVPLKPFKAGSSYINVLTTGLKDSQGRSIEPSSTYATVKQEAPLVTPSQLALQGAVNSYENVVVSSGDITKDDIIFSAAMTMQSAGPVLGTIKKVLAASLTEPTIPTPALQIPTQPMANVQQAFALQGVTVPDVFQAAQYQKGSIQLPMYLGTPEGKEISDLNDTYWQGMCDSAVAILGYKAQAGEAFPTDPISTNDAMCAALSDGQLRDLGLDSTKHLTKYNSLPKVQSMANVPVQITKPILPVVNAYRTGLGLEPFTAMPAGGWPVVIMQHGITTQKESMLTLTAQLSLQGFATVAIDHPRHGERGVDVDLDGNDDFNATTGSVLSYMNLSSLLVARDSLRQSSADLLGLRLGLNFSGDSAMNSQDVSYIGHSLGSIVAPAFIAQANSPLADQVDPFFKVNAVALASGGGGIASFLLESAAFGPFIQGSVLSQAGTAEADEFNAFLNAGALSNCGALLPDMQDFLSCGFNEFAASLTMAGEADKLANIKGVMTQFVFAAQTALDSGDPTNYAATVKALETPVYMNVVVGDGTDSNKPDQVIPPMTANNPIAGTLPLANFMGLETVSTSQAPTEMGSSYLVKFNTGHHGSILTPAQDEGESSTVAGSAAANAEMQLQVATYLASRGRLLMVQNTEVVTN
ncbi:acetoin dehydrogenase dihydrolipoyllysine-residue acetyltransferase subunit [Pseudoalteromonas sp. S3260]|uniref:VolA/Pla-1 family phospholipase n=1 Tax=unclassified Pseudoalteromonas TaxID=194690 RepID=UPI0009753E56|nr:MULTISPECIES: VolA/Pla-1 family phospholipase [unclassified Pseudoalteromonas]TMO97412.1 acetoin dehydrogenase dihydrolipoyllysine-residue acetyltransferase subunit [Pseudoalteromonas sp. S3260]